MFPAEEMHRTSCAAGPGHQFPPGMEGDPGHRCQLPPASPAEEMNPMNWSAGQTGPALPAGREGTSVSAAHPVRRGNLMNTSTRRGCLRNSREGGPPVRILTHEPHEQHRRSSGRGDEQVRPASAVQQGRGIMYGIPPSINRSRFITPGASFPQLGQQNPMPPHEQVTCREGHQTAFPRPLRPAGGFPGLPVPVRLPPLCGAVGALWRGCVSRRRTERHGGVCYIIRDPHLTCTRVRWQFSLTVRLWRTNVRLSP